jgi:hypothetical protein
MNPLQRATYFNNKGVSLLESNDTVRAIQVIQNGIQLIKAYAHDQSTRGLIQTPYVDSSSHFRVTTGMKLKGLKDELYYTYDRPLLLINGSNIPVADNFDSSLDIYVASVVMIFNLALSYHMHAKQCGLSSSLQHAIKMYHVAMKMADGIELDQYLGKALTCFIFNNLASLHGNICEYDTCEYCFKCINDSFCNDAYVDLYTMGLLDEEEWVEIKLNCIYGQFPSAAQAA